MKHFIKLLQVFILLLIWGAASAQAPYCTTPYTYGCQYGDGLILFQLNTINQPIPCSGTPSYYHDYTGLSTTMQTGTPYVLTMQAGYSSTWVDVWIDLNNNNVFDQPGELLVNDFVCVNSNTNYTTNITVPMGTTTGNHRLRFRTEWAGAVTDPCANHYYGNAADFTINVTAGGPPPPPPPATVTIGTGTSSCAYPYTTYWMDGRTQLLLTSSEIIANGGAPGEISQIGFNVYSYTNQVMNNFSIKLMNTTMTSITGWTSSGMSECYLGTYAVTATGWQMITLQTPFVWDGSNLLVEICYDNTSYTYYSFVYGSSAPGMIYYYYTDLPSGSGCNFTANYSTTIRPNFRFVVQPWIGTVQGTVTSNFNGNPINGATVTIAGVPPATTNAAGTYTIYNVPTGLKNVTASATGYVPKTKQTTVVNLQTSTVDFALDPVPAYLSGVVTNAATGAPVIGARVAVNNAPYNSYTYSIAGGSYTLNIYPVGNLTVTATKPGFDNFTAGPFVFIQGNTQLLDIPLLENVNPPGLFTAALNAGETAVDLNWALPNGLYEMIYDDGGSENFTVWATGGNQNAVKFTPVGYPATVIGGRVNIGTIDNYPSGSNPLVPFKMAIYDDDGTGGLPGTAIDTMDVTPTALGWVNYTFPTPVTVNSGSFYLVMIQGGNFPDAAGVLIDETAPPSLRSYSRFITGGGPWIPASGDLFIRAIVNGPGGPLDVDLLEPKYVETTAAEGAMYDHQPLPTSGYQAIGKFLPFDYSSLTVNTQTDGNQPSPVTTGPSVEEGIGVTGYNGTTIELDPTDAVLFNNGPLVNSPGTGAGGADESLLQAPINTYGYSMANGPAYYVTDDFTVTGNGWLITSVDLYGYQTGSTTTSTFTGAYIQIWSAQPGTAGATVLWGNRTTNRMVSTSFTNIYRVNAVNGGTSRPIMKITASTAGLTLNPGTYWIEWSTTGSLASGPWVPPVTLNNIPLTGNGMQWSGTAWVALDSPTASGNYQGLPFILNGSTISAPGSLNYQVWRLLQGQEGNQGVWTSLGTTNTTTMVDNSWPSLPCNPYRWAVKAIYPVDRFSPPTFSNVLGKCWVADVTVHVTLTCAAHPEENTMVKLQNTAYPDTVYIGITDTNGVVFFDNVWKGNYTLSAIRFSYDVYTQVVDITGDQTIEVMLLQQKTPPTNLFVDDKSLEAIWNSPKSVVTMFTETWASGNFTANQWVISGGTNWMMNTSVGNPAPAAMFSWTPSQTNYNQFLTSKNFTGINAPQQLLKYDILFDDFSTATEETLAVEIWDGATWTVLKTYSNQNGGFSWTSEVLDISAWNDITFKIRFHAAGANSFNIDYWRVDNISIIGTDGITGLNPCVLGYNFYLNNVLSAFTVDTTYTIPGNQVQYGTLYNACVNAVYGSGYSTQSCYAFTSHFLYPPLNLEVEAIECSAYLSWEQPVTLDLVRVPAYKGEVTHTPAETGLAPTPDGPRSSTINRNTDGTIIFGFEAFVDGTVDFDVDNVSAFTFIGGNTASDFINGMAFLPGQPDDAYAVAYGGGNLYSINHATGTMTVVGYLGSNSFHDLAIDPGTGIIYGTTLSALYTIDPTVPSATLVGNHGAATTMIAIGCDGGGDLYGYDITTDMWYSIDKTTGAATQIGSIGFNSSYAQGMFYDQPTGNLMMAAYNAGNSQTEIRVVDVTTGSSVILSNGSGMEITGAAYPITSGGGQTPAGLIGYNVYRDGAFIAFVSGADTTWYYDLNLDPDDYEYAVTAKYDLTEYGFPGQFDESIIEGPETVSIMCGRPLPFYEPWDQATFAYNDWTFAPAQGNWTINTGLGNPLPTADFSWQPMVTDYSYGLESPVLNAGPWTCAMLWFDFDYKLADRNATGDELLSVEVFYNGSWHQKLELANNGSVDWTPVHIDISAAQGKALKVRFVAMGANSADILHWYVDNVHIYGICNSPVDLDYTQSEFTTTLTWTAPECTGGGPSTPIDFIFDDGSAENGWAINPGYLAWLGNEFPIAPTYEGVLQSFDVWFGFISSTSMLLTLEVYDGTQTLVGSSDPFTTPYEDWLTINVNDIPFSGLFYGMVKWNTLSGGTNYMGFDEDGPYASDNLGWYSDGTTWEKISIIGGGNPGVFLLRAHALVGGDLKEVTLVPSRQSPGVLTSSPAITGIDGYFDTKNYGTLGVSDNLSDSSQIIGYNVFRTDETGTGPYTQLNGAPVTATMYVDTYPGTLEAGTFMYYVTAVYNDSQTGTFLCESPGSDTVEVEFPAIGINETGKGSVMIFPNPATEVVNIKSDATIATIEVMNFVGQTVYTASDVRMKTAKVNVTTLTAGVYFVKVTTDQGIRTAKITVTH